MKGIDDIEGQYIDLKYFRAIDTIYKETKFSVICECRKGLTIFGNTKEGKKNGDWIFQRDGYSVSGQFNDDMMNGKWFYQHYRLTYVNGKRTNMRIPY